MPCFLRTYQKPKRHGRSPVSGTGCSKVCLRALPCGAETCATRILSSVNDERTVKCFTTKCLAVATGSGGWVKMQCENTCSVRRALIGAAEDGHAMQTRTKSSRHRTTVNKTRYVRMPCFLRTYQKPERHGLFLAQSARKYVSELCLAVQTHAPPYFNLSSTPCVPGCPPASGARMTSVGKAGGPSDAVLQYQKTAAMRAAFFLTIAGAVRHEARLTKRHRAGARSHSLGRL